MVVDVSGLLREFGLSIVEGAERATWLLQTPDGEHVTVEPTSPVPRLSAHITDRRTGRRSLLVGGTATDAVVRRAHSGQLDILTADPPRLIHSGHSYTLTGEPTQPVGRPASGRAAWARWTIERYLMLTQEPTRQRTIADAARTTQQSVSNTVRHLGALVVDEGAGLIAADRAGLLEHWMADYAGPGGLRFGWYSLDPLMEQTRAAIEAADLVEAKALISGDVAADHLAPWKLPARGLLYLDRPVDLEHDGFVPAPLEEATFITCIPDDPSLWWLTDLHAAPSTSATMPLADPAIVYRDLRASGEMDSGEASDHLATLMLRGSP